MALYREGKAAMTADGTVTGTGTKWQSSLSLIRPGATIMFLSSPIQMAVVNKVVSDTEIKAITTNGAVVASTDYAILLSDSLTVDGLAQDVAETLRYYQSQETVIADAVEFFKNFDFESLQNLANQIKADSEAAESSAAEAEASKDAAKISETNSKASEVAAETARDQVQQIINDAGEQSTLVALAQPDGFKNVGVCPNAATLRTIEPSKSGQNIMLMRAVDSGPIINVIATHKPGSSAGDDGYSTFVNATGDVYQLDVSHGIDYRYAGALLDGSNAGECIKKIVDTEVAKAISAGSIDACKKVVLINPLGNDDATQLTLDTDETFVVPSFMSLWHVGQIRYKFNGLTKPAFRVCNEIDGLTSSMADFVDIQGADVIKGNGYLIDIAGPNPMTYSEWAAVPVESRSAAAGVEFGNTYSSGSLLDCRDTNIENVLIRGFKGGLQWNGFDTYINTFKNINLVSNEYSFYAPTADKSNSGEKIVFDGGVAGNCFRSHFYWNQVGMSMTFRSWSFDYAKENVIELRSSGRGNDFIFENCWFEGWGGFLIRQYPITTTWSYRRNKIGFYNSKIVGAKTSQSEWAPRRKIIFAPNDNNIIEFINTPIEWPSPPSEPQIALMGYTDDTIKYNRSKFECPNNPYEDELLSYAYGLNGDGYKFSGTEGVSVKDSKDTATNISVDTNNNSTAFKVEYGPLDEDGLRCLKITTTATTDLVVLSNKQLKVKAPKHTIVNAGISIKMAAVTAGAVKFGMQLRAYNNPVSVADLDTGAVTKTYSLNGSLASDPYDVTSLLSAAGTPLTTDKYVGVQTSRVMAFDNTVAMHFVPTITLTGFIGTIYVKLPVWWISSGSASSAFSIEES